MKFYDLESLEVLPRIYDEKQFPEDFSVIELPDQIVSPQAYAIISTSPLKKIYKQLMSGSYALVKTDEGYEVTHVIEFKSSDGLVGPEAVLEYVLSLDEDKPYVSALHKLIRFGTFLTPFVIVLPAKYRKSGKYYTEVEKYYKTIFKLIKNDADIIFIQRAVDSLVDYILSKLGGKTGIFRKYLSGKNLDLSARAVIVPGDVPSTHIEVPYLILLELYKIEIARYLVTKYSLTYREAFEKLDEMYEKKDISDEIKQVIDEIASEQYILSNRQPTLHRGSILPFKIKPVDGFTIGINPFVCFPTNSDFDGDQHALYHVENQEEVKHMMDVAPFSPANGELYYLPKQDIVYSIYKLTKTEEGRKYLSGILGVEIQEQLDKKKVVQLLKDEFKKDPMVLERLRQVANELTLEEPTTLTLSDFNLNIKVELTGNLIEDNKKLKEAEEKLKEVFPKKDIIKSGARGSFQQIRQMSVARGYVADFWGNIVKYPIKHSYLEGLTPEEFFYSNYGTRKAVLDTAFNVADSGYLTRRLVYLLNSAILDRVHEDCGTSKTMKIYVEDIKLANSLKYRYYYEMDPEEDPNVELKYVDDPTEIVEKTIYLRTPIHCTSEKICKTCYGNLADIHKSSYIGIIAAQSLGERSTQLTLRTFHTGGVAETRSNTEKQQDITSDLTVVEKIIDKNSKVASVTDIYNVVQQLYNVFKNYGDIHLVHYELVASEKIWRIIDDYEYVKWRLTDQNDFENVIMVSTRTAPAYQSPVLAAMFEKAKEHVVKGIIKPPKNDTSVLDKLLLGLI